MDEGDNIQAGR